MAETINARAVEMLEILQGVCYAAQADFRDALHISTTTVRVAAGKLLFRGFIVLADGPGKTKKYAITEEGRRSLRVRAEVTRSHPNTSNLFLLPVYTPPKPLYTRNSGNRHIASAGVRC